MISKPISTQSPLTRLRTKFRMGEKLPEPEHVTNEFKLYYFPLSFPLQEELQKCMLGYLNKDGGCIFIGVSDAGIVEGTNLSEQQYDEVRRMISYSLILNFYPSIRGKQMVQVDFFDVYHSQVKMSMRKVVRVTVKQGGLSDIYFATIRSPTTYIRDGSVVHTLTGPELVEEVKERLNKSSVKEPDHESAGYEQANIFDVGEEAKTEIEEEERELPDPRGSTNSLSTLPLSVADKDDLSSWQDDERQSMVSLLSSPKVQLTSVPLSDGFKTVEHKSKKYKQYVYEVKMEGLPPIFYREFCAIFCAARYPEALDAIMHTVNRERGRECDGSARMIYLTEEEADEFVSCFNGKSVRGKQITYSQRKLIDNKYN